MYSILLVEDDSLQRTILKKMLQELEFSIHIYEASDENEALSIIHKVNIDFFFIDIQLKNSSGLEFAFKLRKYSKYEFSWIIFLTSHIEYVTQAFKEIHCYDFILKPYDKIKVLNMIKKIIEHDMQSNNVQVKRKSISFKIENGLYVKVYIDEIIFIEVSAHACIIHTKQRRYTINRMSLKKILKLIDYCNIVQSHKSFAVNINHINEIIKIDSKLQEIHFEECAKSALLGYKFKDYILENLKHHSIDIK